MSVFARKTYIWPLLTLAVLVGCFIFNEARVRSAMRPPSDNCTFAELAAKVPPARRLAVIGYGDGARLVWVGGTPPMTLHSGPPCYVFDVQGRLVNWTDETGEGSPLDKVVTSAYGTEAITSEQAVDWIRAAK